jgi:lichenan operon transcriptional antiterminator
MNLNLSCSLTEGVTLKANEFEKRNIYLWVMSKKINMSTGSKYSNYLFSDNRIMNVFVILNQIIVELGKSHGIFFAGNSVYFFTLCVCIHYQRSINGYLVTGGETDQPYYPFIQSLRQRAIQEFGQDLTEAEWTQIQRCYLSSQFRSASHLQDILTIESERIYNQFVFEVKKHSEINALMMSRNRIKLQSQIATMINRLKYNLPIPNRIDDEAKDSLPRSYGLAELITPIVLRHTGLNVNQIELVYLALYFEVMISQSQPMIKTLLVCDHDESIITYIQHRLALVFEESLVIRQVIGFMEISHEQADLNGIDFIITTSNIADITDFPFVKINPLIDRHDISAIQEQIIKLI